MLAQARDYNMRPEVAEKRLASQKRLRAENPNKYKKMQAESFQRNKAKIYAYRNERAGRDPAFKISTRFRTYIGNVLKHRCGHNPERFVELLGCTEAQLKSYLESRFKPGMTWENWTSDGWHIDHIRPLASFDLRVREQRLAAFHYANLAPEWSANNHSKNSTWNGHRWRHSDHSAQVARAVGLA